VRALIALLLLGCSDGGPAPAPPRPATPTIGPPTELALLAASDATFNHAAEVSIAARGGVVLVASDQLAMPSADDWAADGNYLRRVAVAASSDGGVTFGATIDPGLAADCSDPVVRRAADGRFWLASITTTQFRGLLASTRDGVEWTHVGVQEIWGDKDWIAVDEAGGSVAVAADQVLGSYSFDGTPSLATRGSRAAQAPASPTARARTSSTNSWAGSGTATGCIWWGPRRWIRCPGAGRSASPPTGATGWCARRRGW
jgi:hypothetical protein